MQQKSSCSCDLHGLYRRSRISMINDYERNKRYETAIISAARRIKEKKGCDLIEAVLLGDDPFLGFIAASVGVIVNHKESRSFFREISKKRISENHMDTKIHQISDYSENPQKKFDLVLAEPFYYETQRQLPWVDIVKFIMDRNEVAKYCNEEYEVIPSYVEVKGVVVNFENFQKQFDEVKVDGINLECFNDALSCVQPLTSHSLWMYKWEKKSEVFDIIEFDLSSVVDGTENSGVVECEGKGNAVVIWSVFAFDGEVLASNDPLDGYGKPGWEKQAVWILKNEETEDVSQVAFDASFDVFDSEIKVNFRPQ